MDNSALHGPGGQTSYEDPTEADPCFARVIEGQDVVDIMGQSPTKEGLYKAMVDNIAITSMRIIVQDEGNRSKPDEVKREKVIKIEEEVEMESPEEAKELFQEKAEKEIEESKKHGHIEQQDEIAEEGEITF